MNCCKQAAITLATPTFADDKGGGARAPKVPPHVTEYYVVEELGTHKLVGPAHTVQGQPF
jgi:hypothetical protein